MAHAANGLDCCHCANKIHVNNDGVRINDRIENLRFLCCGKIIHANCWKKSTLRGQGGHRCPFCKTNTRAFRKTGKIIKSLKKWAKKRKTWAVTDLAMMTYFGEGVPRDRSKGIEMLTKSIASGDVNAMAYLGGIYWDTAIQGKELEPKQSTEMVELLTRAGNFDHPRAIQNLGALYWTGIGVDQCKDKAIELATKAAILNNQNAIQDLTRPAYMKYQEKNKTRTTTINQCAQCHKPLDAKKLTACPCKSVNYCGKECQKLHWKTHRNEHRHLLKEIQRNEAAARIRVPEDCSTLKEAVKKVQEDRFLTTIVVGEGEHQIDDGYLHIFSAINIVGDSDVPKEKIVVVGGIMFTKGIQGNCHLQHMVLRQANMHGVNGCSSFTMEDVIVEQCRVYGMKAQGTDVFGRCTNVEVRQCGSGGVAAYNGASITLIGAKTTVHHNCTEGDSDDYGLEVYLSLSSIQLISPLTKEQISIDNGGGGNWGASHGGDINQIKTIDAPAHAGETKTSTPTEPIETKTPVPIEPDKTTPATPIKPDKNCFNKCSKTLPRENCFKRHVAREWSSWGGTMSCKSSGVVVVDKSGGVE